MNSRRVGILGGGRFGLGLAAAARRAGNEVILFTRRTGLGTDGLQTTTDLSLLVTAEPILLAVPSSHAADVAAQLSTYLDGRHLLVHVSRGLVGDELRTVSQVFVQRTAVRRVGVLAGPLVADALQEGTPGGGVVASEFPEVVSAVRQALRCPSLRLYSSEDLIGVEASAALCGLLSFMIGYMRKMGFGPGALSVLTTRGLGEAARIGVSLGGREQSFQGLAGVGDVMAAVANDGRPEVQVGEALVGGASVADAVAEQGAFFEGLDLAGRVAAHATRRGIDAPILQVAAEVLTGRLKPEAALSTLMDRPVGRE